MKRTILFVVALVFFIPSSLSMEQSKEIETDLVAINTVKDLVQFTDRLVAYKTNLTTSSKTFVEHYGLIASFTVFSFPFQLFTLIGKEKAIEDQAPQLLSRYFVAKQSDQTIALYVRVVTSDELKQIQDLFEQEKIHFAFYKGMTIENKTVLFENSSQPFSPQFNEPLSLTVWCAETFARRRQLCGQDRKDLSALARGVVPAEVATIMIKYLPRNIIETHASFLLDTCMQPIAITTKKAILHKLKKVLNNLTIFQQLEFSLWNQVYDPCKTFEADEKTVNHITGLVKSFKRAVKRDQVTEFVNAHLDNQEDEDPFIAQSGLFMQDELLHLSFETFML